MLTKFGTGESPECPQWQRPTSCRSNPQETKSRDTTCWHTVGGKDLLIPAMSSKRLRRFWSYGINVQMCLNSYKHKHMHDPSPPHTHTSLCTNQCMKYFTKYMYARTHTRTHTRSHVYKRKSGTLVGPWPPKAEACKSVSDWRALGARTISFSVHSWRRRTEENLSAAIAELELNWCRYCCSPDEFF